MATKHGLPSMPVFRRFFSILKFLLPAPIATLPDKIAGLLKFPFVAKESGAVEVDVGHVKFHRTALGDLLGFVEVGARLVEVVFQPLVPMLE